jgi:2-C-methyl-D-erythritol 2,4-cyclodiphosphate synthase
LNIRVGHGFDVHPLVDGDGVWIGGIKIPYHKKLDGHSDADVLIHAICDALLGALNLRDIGFHFPNTDERYKGIDSKKLLANVMELVIGKGYSIGNIDCTVVAESPKINPHIEAMQHCLSPILNISVEDISIKATTNEQLGFIGRGEGIVAHATCLVHRKILS